MSSETITLLMFVALLSVLLTGLPVAFALPGVAVVFGLFLWGDANFLYLFGQRIIGVMTNYILVAGVMFIFMGCVLSRSGIADSLYGSLHMALGRLRGGLAISTVLISTLLAASTGIVGASITLMGLVALPAMLQRRYDIKLAMGSIMAGGCLGILIPPSIMLILYGAATGVSVARLFAGAIMPGLILSSLYVIYIIIRCLKNPALGPGPTAEERALVPLSQKLFSVARSALPPLALVLIVLGSIFTGIATPTEAAGVGAFATVVLTACYRKLSWTMIRESVYETIRIQGFIIWILIGASCFSAVFMGLGGGDVIRETLLGLEVSRWIVFVIIMAIVLVLGMFLDWIGIILICVPIFMPIIEALGFDPLWFSIMFAVNLQVSFLSPPFGYALFFMKGLAPEGTTMWHVYQAAAPFIPIQIIGLILCAAFPPVILWFPNLIFG